MPPAGVRAVRPASIAIAPTTTSSSAITNTGSSSTISYWMVILGVALAIASPGTIGSSAHLHGNCGSFATGFCSCCLAKPQRMTMPTLSTTRTLYQKIWDDHVVQSLDDGTALIFIDRHLIHEGDDPAGVRGAAHRRPPAASARSDACCAGSQRPNNRPPPAHPGSDVEGATGSTGDELRRFRR